RTSTCAKYKGFVSLTAGIVEEAISQNRTQDPPVHVELWQYEFQLVSVAVVANLFDLGHALQASGAVLFDERRNIGVPPMAAGHHVGEDPTVTGQFLILSSGKDW